MHDDIVCRHATSLSDILFFLLGHRQRGTISDCHQWTPDKIDKNGADDDGQDRRTDIPEDGVSGELTATFVHGNEVLDGEDHGDNNQR